jgi:hypothetical protein
LIIAGEVIFARNGGLEHIIAAPISIGGSHRARTSKRRKHHHENAIKACVSPHFHKRYMRTQKSAR